MHNSWALVRLAAQFLKQPENDIYDLAKKAGINQQVVDSLVPRMAAEGWLATDEGWVFRLTEKGRLALTKKIQQSRSYGRETPR